MQIKTALSWLMIYFSGTFFTLSVAAQEPILFASEILSENVEYSLTITPDQQTIYFVKTDSFYVSKPQAIYRSNWENGSWSTPEVAGFSGQYSDSSPFVSPDGKTLFFTSRRPVHGQEVNASNIWMVTLEKNGEGEPIYLEIVNSDKSEYSPTVDQAGNLYFGSYREGGHGWGDIWRSAWKEGTYQVPENLGPVINSREGEWGSCIAPDGSFLIFEASGWPENLSYSGDLYISFHKEGIWQQPIHFPEPINSIGSDLTPKIHGGQFYFASNRHEDVSVAVRNNNVDLYVISLENLLQKIPLKKE